MHAVVLLNINQHTTFEVPSFTDSKDITGGQNKKTGHDSRDPHHAHYGAVSRPKANTWNILPA